MAGCLVFGPLVVVFSSKILLVFLLGIPRVHPQKEGGGCFCWGFQEFQVPELKDLAEDLVFGGWGPFFVGTYHHDCFCSASFLWSFSCIATFDCFSDQLILFLLVIFKGLVSFGLLFFADFLFWAYSGAKRAFVRLPTEAEPRMPELAEHLEQEGLHVD